MHTRMCVCDGWPQKTFKNKGMRGGRNELGTKCLQYGVGECGKSLSDG